jgi:hypothetical protein
MSIEGKAAIAAVAFFEKISAGSVLVEGRYPLDAERVAAGSAV